MFDQNDTVYKFWEAFVQLRQHGTNRDDAWYAVLERAEQDETIEKADIKRLLGFAKDWERREGHKYQYRNTQDAGATYVEKRVVKPPPAPDQTSLKSPLRPPSQMTGELNPAALRAYEQQQIEQVLNAPPEVKAATAPIKAQAEPVNPAYFTEKTLLLIYTKGYPEPLQIHLRENSERIIGRIIPGSVMTPDIDLTPLGAEIMGVSRMHAAIVFQKNSVLIADIGSTNGIYLNGRLLLPQEVRALQDRDEIWFGQLVCRIRFFHT